jgi:hypothetical protein
MIFVFMSPISSKKKKSFFFSPFRGSYGRFRPRSIEAAVGAKKRW